jgi:hypothetical protein
VRYKVLCRYGPCLCVAPQFKQSCQRWSRFSVTRLSASIFTVGGATYLITRCHTQGDRNLNVDRPEHPNCHTEQNGPKVALRIAIRKVLGMNLGSDTGYPELRFSSVPSGKYLGNTLMGHKRLLQNPFQFIIHQSPYHPTLYSLGIESAHSHISMLSATSSTRLSLS